MLDLGRGALARWTHQRTLLHDFYCWTSGFFLQVHCAGHLYSAITQEGEAADPQQQRTEDDVADLSWPKPPMYRWWELGRDFKDHWGKMVGDVSWKQIVLVL